MALHDHPVLKPLLSPDLTLPRYKIILSGFYQHYQIWEPAFSSFVERFEGEATPLEWLEKDFKALNIKMPSIINAIKPIDISFDSYLGYLYVKQGSTLGGQVISAALQKNLGLLKGESLFFFDGYGKDTGKRWRGLLEYLELQQRDIDYKTALLTARFAFNSLEKVFSSIR